jgi:hypothetical protein
LCVVGRWDGAAHVGAVEVVVDVSTVPTTLQVGTTVVAHLVVARDGALRVARLAPPAVGAPAAK